MECSILMKTDHFAHNHQTNRIFILWALWLGLFMHNTSYFSIALCKLQSSELKIIQHAIFLLTSATFYILGFSYFIIQNVLIHKNSPYEAFQILLLGPSKQHFAPS